MQAHPADPKPSPFSTQFPSEVFTNRFVDPSLYIQANPYDSLQENAMPSDGRYTYPGPPHPAMTYDYSAYPPAPYDPVHYPPSHQPQRPILPPSYHQYPPATHPHYGIPPQQWSPDGWSHYSFIQPMHPPPIQDLARPDMNNSISVDPSRYPPSTPNRPESSIAGATEPLAESHSQDRSKPSTSELSPSSPSFDFMKILESCRLIIDSSSPFVSDATLNAPGRPPPAEVMDRMLASANTSLKIMEAAVKEAEGRKPESSNSSDQIVNGNGHTPAAAPREPSTSPKPTETPQVPEGQTCLGCKATSTPEWRRGPMGPRTLCNACGLVYAKLIKKRGREARARTNGKSSKAEIDNLDELAGISSEEKSDYDDDDDEISADEG